ncbi:putative multi-domain containing protein [Aduncisulcus paluster]|uniref:Ribokinase n=1 Tax=Aduncisulcus paluster TaxID=2918883 RepID=A0ABQ5K894_9EUKA|nr:putative multi-domain containing protein [Aduncisulcus paluster]
MYISASLPLRGQTILGRLEEGHGGKGNNQAIACVKSHVPTRFCCALGEDAHGKEAQMHFDSYSIDSSHVISIPDKKTGSAGIFVGEKDGANSIIVAAAANMCLEPKHAIKSIDKAVKTVVMQFEIDLTTVLAVGNSIREMTTPPIFIINPAPIPTSHPLKIYECISKCDICTPNETEFIDLLHIIRDMSSSETKDSISELSSIPDASLLSSLSDEELIKLCRFMPCPCVIITMGGAGCFIYLADSTECVTVPAIDVKPIDTTGAGDAFTGAFAAFCTAFCEKHGEVSIRSPEKKPFVLEMLKGACRFGCIVAGKSTESVGTSSAIPTIDVHEYL